MANTIAGEETVHNLASLLLVFLGGCYVLLFLSGKGGHSHNHNQPMEKMAVAGLILVPALSPCATTLPVFLAVGNSSSMMILAIIVLLFRYWSIALKYLTSTVLCLYENCIIVFPYSLYWCMWHIQSVIVKMACLWTTVPVISKGC